MPTFLALLGMFISVMLIGIILLQRGRGGGLVGALSGLGGQSAFGTKAGDTFTRITIAIAAVWVVLAGLHGILLRSNTEKFKNDPPSISSTSKDKDGGAAKSDDSKSKSGIGSSSDDSKEDDSKVGDSKATTKPDDSTKEIAPEDDLKTKSAPKSNEPPKKVLDGSPDVKSDTKPDEKSGDTK